MLTLAGIVCVGAIVIALLVALPFAVATAYKKMDN